jgi:hypothetical protein
MDDNYWIDVNDDLPARFTTVLCISNKGRYSLSCIDNSLEWDPTF